MLGKCAVHGVTGAGNGNVQRGEGGVEHHVKRSREGTIKVKQERDRHCCILVLEGTKTPLLRLFAT